MPGKLPAILLRNDNCTTQTPHRFIDLADPLATAGFRFACDLGLDGRTLRHGLRLGREQGGVDTRSSGLVLSAVPSDHGHRRVDRVRAPQKHAGRGAFRTVLRAACFVLHLPVDRKFDWAMIG